MILEVRTNRGMFFGWNDEILAMSFETRIGHMPEPYNTVAQRRIRKERRQPDDDKDLDPSGPVSSSADGLVEAMKMELEDTGYTEIFVAQVGQQHHIWRKPRGVNGLPDMRQRTVQIHFRIPDEEVPVVANFIRHSFRYDPSERFDLAGIMNHEWFGGRMSRSKH
ncbi:hypothetical protein DL769_003177 [Monosporascus sp. CRB-8-3]|nr:hypothetical protein DL769_003177 [Monosporascus sp. CRB-8-3]